MVGGSSLHIKRLSPSLRTITQNIVFKNHLAAYKTQGIFQKSELSPMAKGENVVINEASGLAKKVMGVVCDRDVVVSEMVR